MKSRVEQAIGLFSDGCNCAQSVLVTYAPLLGMREEEAMAVACPFGAGMGRTQEVCGAVTGAFMAVGLAKGMRTKAQTAAKEETYALVQDITSRFVASHGSVLCKALLGCDLRTQQGHDAYENQDLHHVKCETYVRECAAMVEELVFPA